MVSHTCNLSIWEAEAGRLQVEGQPWLHSETLSQKIQPKQLTNQPNKQPTNQKKTQYFLKLREVK
jgi:hypothetical protein